METTSEEYKQHLESKYLPGRNKYLQWFFYPKILWQFSAGEIVDLGCGTGEFLRYLKLKERAFYGIDNNSYLIEKCRKEGFEVFLDDVTELKHIKSPLKNAIIDNVLEHLTAEQIDAFFFAVSKKMVKGSVLVVIVPDKKGYKYDPTHKTFVNKELIKEMCLKYGLRPDRTFRHPFNSAFFGRILYLNMQVFRICA